MNKIQKRKGIFAWLLAACLIVPFLSIPVSASPVEEKDVVGQQADQPETATETTNKETETEPETATESDAPVKETQQPETVSDDNQETIAQSEQETAAAAEVIETERESDQGARAQTAAPRNAMKPVRVPDELLRKSILDKLGLDDDWELTVSDFELLDELEIYCDDAAGSQRLTSLQGLQYAVNLETLWIEEADLSADDSLAPIKDLENLFNLDLLSCRISEKHFSVISGLTKLAHLGLDNNGIRDFTALKPLVDAKMSQYQQAVKDGTLDSFDFVFHAENNPIEDFSGVQPYFMMLFDSAKRSMNEDKEANWNALNQVVSQMAKQSQEVAYTFAGNYNDHWNLEIMKQIPNLATVGALKPSAEEAVYGVPVRQNIVGVNGERMLFWHHGDWSEDIGQSHLEMPEEMGLRNVFEIAALRAFGPNDGLNKVEDITGYFTLETRPSRDYPGETEYYYKGRQMNIVPYNPYATGADDRQAALVSGSDRATVYYYEFKKFDETVPNVASLFNAVSEDGAEFYLAGNVYDTSISTSAYLYGNGSNSFIFSQQLRFWRPTAPVITGVKDTTIYQGDSFDPLKGVAAHDPTVDGDNPDGKTPTDLTDRITVSGAEAVKEVGEYTIQYSVVSEYNLTTQATCVVKVLEKQKDTDPPEPSTGKLEEPDPEDPPKKDGSKKTTTKKGTTTNNPARKVYTTGGTVTKSAPWTGDGTDYILPIILLCGSAACITLLRRKKRA